LSYKNYLYKRAGQRDALQQKLQALRLKAEQERVAQESYVRGVEDRAHREVDRAREEGKAMAAQLKEAGRLVERLQRRLESIQIELSQTQQRAVAQHARAETLEQQLTQVRQVSESKRKTRNRKAAAPSKIPNCDVGVC
jgi:chromosome segregation ATPase